MERKFKVDIGKLLDPIRGQNYEHCIIDAEPQIQTTHTFSAELPDGRVVEMPAPEGWEIVEREEFKRGDMTCGRVFQNYINVRPRKLDEGELYRQLDFLTDYQKAFIHDYPKQIIYHQPILSITTWRREVVPEPPEEEPYDYPCPSRDNNIGLEIWPERTSEVD
jgi:hypothetical protein